MTSTKHTPTPYSLWRPVDGTMRGMEPNYSPKDHALIGANGVAVGVLYGDLDEVEAAQAFIVTAVNAHAGLVEALKALLAEVEFPSTDACDAARAALAAAGEQTP